MHTRPEYRDVTFPGRRADEQILLVLRRHWFVLLTTGIFFAFLLVLPLILWSLLPRGFFLTLHETVWGGLLTLGLSGYYLFLWLFFFTILVDYYLDVWIVTNERIVSIEQIGLFRRVIAEQNMGRVQDVTSEVEGVFPTFLNFGNVYVQTAGERERFVFMQVPNPEGVKKGILQLHQDVLGSSPAEQNAAGGTGATV